MLHRFGSVKVLSAVKHFVGSLAAENVVSNSVHSRSVVCTLLVPAAVVASIFNKGIKRLYCLRESVLVKVRLKQRRFGGSSARLVDELHIIVFTVPFFKSRYKIAFFNEPLISFKIVIVFRRSNIRLFAGASVFVPLFISLLTCMVNPLIEFCNICAGSDNVEGNDDIYPILFQSPIDHLIR